MENSYAVNTIYPTYQGEVNKYGIGKSVIFLRLQGCHLRCYLKPLGILCDTPEGLKKRGGVDFTLDAIINRLKKLRLRTGINYICLSGGDPLWRKEEDLIALFQALEDNGFETSVETSGTISIKPYRHFKSVSWVLDMKLKSAGIKQPFIYEDLKLLTEDDFVKYIIYDMNDYNEFRRVVTEVRVHSKCKIGVGVFWDGKMTNSNLVHFLIHDGYFKDVYLNMQAHKLLTHYDKTDKANTEIPKEI